MPKLVSKLDRYLFGEFAQSFFATLIVLLVVSVGGILADLLGQIAEGKLPAALMLSQMGLNMLSYVPVYVLPLALMLGLLLAFARLYRDSEMAVITSVGVGPRRLLRPLSWLVLPLVALIAVMTIWVGPWADRTSDAMIKAANRSLIVAGLEAGKFTTLSDGSVVYVSGLSDDGRRMHKVFAQRQQGGRLDVVTADHGQLLLDEQDSGRYLQLEQGHRVEGPSDGGLEFRLGTFARSEMAMRESNDKKRLGNDPSLLTISQLLHDPRKEANAQFHARITPPLLALGFALLTLPLSRSSPRQARYGKMMLGFLAYLVVTLAMNNGISALNNGRIPEHAGLWWLSLPLLAFATWWYLRDGRMASPRNEKSKNAGATRT